MHQLQYFLIKNKRTGKSIELECRIEISDSLYWPITYIVDIAKLKALLERSPSVFAKKLLKSGELVIKMRSSRGINADTILEKLKIEFGNGFTITILPGRDIKKLIAIKKFKKKPVYKISKTARKNIKVVKKKPAKKKGYEKMSNFDGAGLESIEATTDKMTVGDTADVNYDTVEVLFATDRNRTNSNDPNKVYGKGRNESNNLEYGVCRISIPPNHKTGNIERPSWYKRLFFSDPENPQKHIVIYDLKVKTEVDILSFLNSKISFSTNKDAFIFIHGFNVSFSEAIRRTAQIAHDLSFKGASISYSWPSLSEVKGYMSDEDSVVWTVPHLKNLIKKVLSDSNLLKLHLIAHSMGNRALTNAIKELKTEGFNLEKINQIVLAAPDIDSNVFTDVIVPGIKNVSKQITLYASSKDNALKFSRRIRSGIIRAGESGDNLVIIDGISTVDASKVDTNLLGHGYFAETKELINDLYLILEYSFEPPQRNLRQQIIPPRGFYWLFPA